MKLSKWSVEWYTRTCLSATFKNGQEERKGGEKGGEWEMWESKVEFSWLENGRYARPMWYSYIQKKRRDEKSEKAKVRKKGEGGHIFKKKQE